MNVSSRDWWLTEPLLAFEVNPRTRPGVSDATRWQEHADAADEVSIVAASNALMTHCLSTMSSHLGNEFSYFRSDCFHENRHDYLADYLEKSRKAGYRTLVYFNVHAVKPAFGAERPEWKQVRFDGTTFESLYGVETTFCVNTPWRDWVRAVCLDLCRYPIDGIFFDGPCLFAKACYCPACRELYRGEYGTPMPPKEGGHPELWRLAQFQAESLRRFLEHCNSAVKAVRPDVALYCNAGSREEPFFVSGRNNRVLIRSQDILAAEGGFVYGRLSDQPHWKVGANAKYYQTQACGKPTAVFCSPAHGPWRSYYQTLPELQLAMAQAPIHGSGVWLSAFTWFKDAPGFQEVAALYKHFSNHRQYYFNTCSKARLAIVWPEESINYYGKPAILHGDFTQGGQAGETAGDIGEEFNGFYDSLVRNHVPCDVIDEESIRSGDLARYDALVLPNMACADAMVNDRLREYVRAGGNLLASFETSICDGHGRRGDDLGLADLFGIHMLRTPLKPFPHFYFFRGEQEALFQDVQPRLLPSPLVSCEVELRGAETITPYSVKFKGWDGSEILPSPFPAITVNRFGKGRAVYCAGIFGALYWNYKQKDIRLLLRNLAYWLSRRDVTLENAPTSVEVAHRESADARSEVVSLINYTGGTRPIEEIQTLRDVVIRVRSQRARARALCLGDNLNVERDQEWLTVRLPLLGVFETVALE